MQKCFFSVDDKKYINHLKVSSWDEKEARRLFQELPFYKVLKDTKN